MHTLKCQWKSPLVRKNNRVRFCTLASAAVVSMFPSWLLAIQFPRICAQSQKFSLSGDFQLREELSTKGPSAKLRKTRFPLGGIFSLLSRFLRANFSKIYFYFLSFFPFELRPRSQRQPRRRRHLRHLQQQQRDSRPPRFPCFLAWRLVFPLAEVPKTGL